MRQTVIVHKSVVKQKEDEKGRDCDCDGLPCGPLPGDGVAAGQLTARLLQKEQHTGKDDQDAQQSLRRCVPQLIEAVAR